jgi:hypothetical protein
MTQQHVRQFGRTRRGEGGIVSTLDVAKAVADYASS